MTDLKQTLAALLVGVGIAVIVSCGGGKSMKTAAPSAASEHGPGAMPGGIDSPRAQIEQLDAKLSSDFARLGAGDRPPAATTSGMQTLSVKPSADPQCKPGESQTCKDTCTLADAICDSAEKICAIAKSMGNDPWANEKCSSGNASCETAHGKCCGCT